MNTSRSDNLISIWPSKIQVTGLPWKYFGWNTEFIKTEDFSEDCPIYYLKPYKFLRLFSIPGVKILKSFGMWVFWTDCSLLPLNITKVGDSSPCGIWNCCTVYSVWK